MNTEAAAGRGADVALDLGHPGLPRDWVEHVLSVVVSYDPDKVFLFGSVAQAEDTVRSDIDLLVAIDRVPVEEWFEWEFRIALEAERRCPFKVDVSLTDLEDLVRRRNVVGNPCKWVAEGGRLIYDRNSGVLL